MADILPAIVAVLTWAFPQPQHSAGLIVIYGGDGLTRANAEWRGYTLDGYAFGLASISPAHLGRVAWVRAPGGRWLGPGLVVDVVARPHAYESIFVRREVAEVTWATAAEMGFTNGGRQGEVWFGVCPPDADSEALPYAPPLAWDYAPYSRTPSYYPYPPQQMLADCRRVDRSPWEAIPQ